MENKRNLKIINTIYQIIEFLGIVGLISFVVFYLFKIYISKVTDFSLANLITLYILLTCYIGLYALICLSFILSLWSNVILVKKFKYILSIILLNPFVTVLKCEKQPKKNNETTNQTKSIILMGIFVALYIVVTFLVSLYQFPDFIEVPIGYGLLIYYSFNNKFLKSFIVCLICSLIEMIIPGIYFMNIFQYYFDYGFIILACSFVSLLRFTTDNKKENRLYWLVILSIVVNLFYVSRVISGILYWFDNQYATYLNRFTYAVIFNCGNVIVDFIILLTIVPITCERLPKYIWYK